MTNWIWYSKQRADRRPMSTINLDYSVLISETAIRVLIVLYILIEYFVSKPIKTNAGHADC